jgi:hypothetical protein
MPRIRSYRDPAYKEDVGRSLFWQPPPRADTRNCAGLYSLAHDGKGALSIWVLSAAAFGALFTVADSGGGAINEFKPKEITVTLTKADGIPRVDTVLIDAEDFRNVKWIRIRRD